MRQARATHRVLQFVSTILAALLCAAPMAAAVAVPADDPEANRELEVLRVRTGGALVARVAKETGSYDFVRGADGAVLFVGDPGLSPEERTFEFLREHGKLLGVRDAGPLRQKVAGRFGTAELELDRVQRDDIGQTHVRLRQIYQGIAVFGGELVVHMDERGILGVNGKFLADLQVDPNPAFSSEAASAVGIARLWKRAPAGGLRAADPMLMVYRTGLLEGYYGSNHLAWAFEVSGPDLRELVFVDAHTGFFLQNVSLRHDAKFRKVYTPEHDPNFLVRQDGTCVNPVVTPKECPNPVAGVENLFVFAGQTYDFFIRGFNRDSYDGGGHVMESVLLINEACPNAYWNGTTTNYCPLFDVDDVVSHEWGHAYTQFTHNLIYAYQSGALNESYSDIWGESVDINNGMDGSGGSNNAVRTDDGDPDPAEPPSSQRWLIGEDIPVVNDPTLQIFRDMWRPDRFGNPDRVGSENYHCTADDGGGVHRNSGIPNHAYAMLVDGAAFNGQTIQGIGFIKAAHIYYRAMTNYQVSTTNFIGHADALEVSCSDLLGVNLKSPFTGSPSGQAISAADCQQVTKAIAAVEMRDDVPCDFQLILDPSTPAICPGQRPVFTEDWETGMDGWTLASAGVTPDWPNYNWAVRGSLPSARSGSAAFAVDSIAGTCAPGGDYSGAFSLTSPVITLPAGAGDFEVRFDHYVETELTYDGGNLLISVNGGAFTLVPQSAYVFNAPPSQLGNALPPPAGDGNTNPKAGQYGWHGTNEGTSFGSWGTTIVNLAGMASGGQTIRLRFDFGIDGCNGVTGWFVDTVQVYACPDTPGPTLAIGPGYENPDTNGSYTLTWTRPPGASGPDTLQESTSSCAPLFFDNAESGFAKWDLSTGAFTWQNARAKPQHGSKVFFAKAPEAFGGDLTMTTKTFITLPAAGVTTLKWLDWNINEEDDKVFVEVSVNGTTWVEVYSSARFADTPDAAAAFATEPLVEREANLTPFNGKAVKIRFRLFHGDLEYFLESQNGWYVDDIAVVSENWTDVVTTTATSFTVTGRNTGAYCYRVRTRYQGGAVLSDPSNLVTINVLRSGTQPPATFTQNPIQDDSNPDQQFGTDRDGRYRLNWTYPAPPTQQACKFRVEEANLFNTVFFDDASQTLTAGSNARWQGSAQWLSFTHPTSNTQGYRVLYTDNLNASLTMKAATPIFANSAALLSFDTYEDIEDGFDFAYVEISADNGATYQTLATYTGAFAGKRTIDLSGYSNRNVKIRFRFTSDVISSAPLFEGWFIDNIRIESANWASIGTTGNGAARTFDVTGRTGSGQSYAYRIGALFGSCTGAPTLYSNARTIPVDIGTAAPTAGFSFSPNPGRKNQDVTFDASASIDHDTVHGSPNPGIVRYRWSFGDGGTLTTTSKTATHKFTSAGTYRVTLTVTDNDGESATTEGQVPVTN